MKQAHVVQHGIYTLSIIVLLNQVIAMIARHFAFDHLGNILLFVIVGIGALILGLFKFKKSLGFGLSIAGLFSLIYSASYYQLKLANELKFLVSLMMLGVVLYAWYLLHNKNRSLKKGK